MNHALTAALSPRDRWTTEAPASPRGRRTLHRGAGEGASRSHGEFTQDCALRLFHAKE